MTREEVKAKLPIIKAFAEGKTIQFYEDGKWFDIYETDFNYSTDKYRIKPEPKYRPFKNREECWQEMQKHQPFGWVKRIDTGNFEHIKSVCQEKILFAVSIEYYKYEDAFKYYKFTDGTPFGIKEN